MVARLRLMALKCQALSGIPVCVLLTPEERDKKVTVKDFFIDLGMEKSEVEKIVEIGTPISRERECIEMGDCVNGKSLDNRIAFIS